MELQIEEVRLTGYEPAEEVSAPLAVGRDFVTERLRIEVSVPEAALELERWRLRETERRLSLGAADGLDVEAARARTVEISAAIEGFRRRIDIRRRLLSGQIDATAVGVAGPRSRRRAAHEGARAADCSGPQPGGARAHAAAARNGDRTDVAEATLRLQRLEADMAQADLDLALVRRQLERRREKR